MAVPASDTSFIRVLALLLENDAHWAPGLSKTCPEGFRVPVWESIRKGTMVALVSCNIQDAAPMGPERRIAVAPLAKAASP